MDFGRQVHAPATGGDVAGEVEKWLPRRYRYSSIVVSFGDGESPMLRRCNLTHKKKAELNE